MIDNAKGITTKQIEKNINENKYYNYEDLHQLAAELVLKDTHNTTPIVECDGDYEGEIYCTFKSKVNGIPDVKTMDFYGTCPFCDTLEGVYDGDNIKNDLATMVLHVIQSMNEQIEEKQ
ncbi:hypothetical protein [Staphylococcus lugdunensis]|uniref:hypothetical protein n=1 Tax=Staphylococcus lugdunensis TaxID=28035 RepID=UPI001F58914B|nr:hypothetical protein [Staphylococcus lugdunensis]MCI2836179.1 hypothetical protein [Staphylococcus lugdunensis]